MKSFITKTNQEMMDLVKSGNYNALDKYYDADAVSLPNYRAKESGYKLILNNNLGRQKGGYQILDGQKTTTQLIVGEDMMVDIGTYTLTMTFPGLTEPKVDNGKYLNVWKKNQEGVWKLVAETWNADKSPNAPASKGQGQPGGTSAPTINQNPKPGAQPGTTAPANTGSGGKTTQTGTGTDAGSKAVPAQGTTTVTKGTMEAKPAQTGTVTGSKAVPATGTTTTTKGTTEAKPAQTGTTKTVTVPAQGTTTKKGTTETKSTQTGTAKTVTVPAQGTTTKTTIDTIQKPMEVPNGGKK